MKLRLSEDTVGLLHCDLDGRLEVMADDGLQGSPDYEDAESVRRELAKPIFANREFEFSSAELQQLLITAENALELIDSRRDEDDPDTETAETELRELIATLKLKEAP